MYILADNVNPLTLEAANWYIGRLVSKYYYKIRKTETKGKIMYQTYFTLIVNDSLTFQLFWNIFYLINKFDYLPERPRECSQ